VDLFLFDPDHLATLATTNADAYRHAEPFPHIVLDDFLPDAVFAELVASFPGPDELAWVHFDGEHERKLASDTPADLPPFAQHVLAQFNAAAIVDFLEALTGIEGLIPDPHLWGGGLHQIVPGGHLDVHTDFNWHPRLLLDRRINLLLYLNEDWRPEWGGDFELWDESLDACRERVAPLANRCVIFSTSDHSFHGHPTPLACPPDRSRRSLALYYYSNGRPASEVGPSSSTVFRPRDGEVWRRPGTSRRDRVMRWVPPAVVDVVRGVRDRRAGPTT
jgi:hypothetical protein